MTGFSSARLTAAVSSGAQAAAGSAKPFPTAGGAGTLLSVDCGGGAWQRGGQRRCLLYVPATYRPGVPAPLILTLHGAGGDAQDGLHHLMSHADTYGTLLLSPESKGSTWDMLRGGFGPDVEFVNRALQQIFQQYDVDPQRVCCSGFSDGASYALSLGAANGDLFSHIAAFSPGFMRPPVIVGRPLVYVSHGEHDRVLRIDYCSRRIVPRLQADGYLVHYSEFNGPHSVPPEIAAEALDWFVGSRAQPAKRED